MAEVVRMMVEAAIEADDGVPAYLPGKQSVPLCPSKAGRLTYFGTVTASRRRRLDRITVS